MSQDPLPNDLSPKETLSPTKIAGRYALFQPIASGGMATVYVGRLLGPSGFGRTVAIKCMHDYVARDPELVKAFLDEAQLAARIRHPNVVPTLDIVSHKDELFLVMDYVHGEALSRLMSEARSRELSIPLPISVAILTGMLQGLHAAHELRDERGQRVNVVHRDVSPQNVLVGTDGVARVMDFGIAKAATNSTHTSTGIIKGKVAYMAPEQMTQREVTAATDLFAVGIVAWEMVVGKRLRPGRGDISHILKLLAEQITPPSTIDPSIPEGLNAAIMRALAKDPKERPSSALVMARELARVVPPAGAWEVAEWMEKLLGDRLSARTEMVQEVEVASGLVEVPKTVPPPATPAAHRPPEPAAASPAAASPAAANDLDAPPSAAAAGWAPAAGGSASSPLVAPCREDSVESGNLDLSRSLNLPAPGVAHGAAEVRPTSKRAVLLGAGLAALGVLSALPRWLPHSSRPSEAAQAAPAIAASQAPLASTAATIPSNPAASPSGSPAASPSGSPAASPAAPSAAPPTSAPAPPPASHRALAQAPQPPRPAGRAIEKRASPSPKPDEKPAVAATPPSYSEQ